MKSVLIPLALAAMVSAALANTAPTPVIVSAAMRPNTTYMDVVYRVNDPDDATVKVRALAFVDGVRSFAKVLRPVTFVDGTASKIGDAIASNTNHTLSWDVGADWNIDLGQVKFEILCRDARGLLAFDWITIPAAGGNPALTISKDGPSDASVLSAFFWLYADGDPWLMLTNGVLTGNAGSGVFSNVSLVNGSVLQVYGTAYLFKRMNLDPADSLDKGYAINGARAGLLSNWNWHAINRPYTGVSRVVSSGTYELATRGLNGVTSIAAGNMLTVFLESDGTVRGTFFPPPEGLTGVTAVAAGSWHGVALKSNGTVVCWGQNDKGQAPLNNGLTGIVAIAAGDNHNLALKSDGTVVGWGSNATGQITIPAGLTGVTALSGGINHSLALKSDGTVVGWGNNGSGEITIPAGLNGVTAIAAGGYHSLALKSDGTVVGWGANNYQQRTIPAGLTGVIAIGVGTYHSLALKDDGTVVVWGKDAAGQIATGMTDVTVISSGCTSNYTVVVKAKAP